MKNILLKNVQHIDLKSGKIRTVDILYTQDGVIDTIAPKISPTTNCEIIEGEGNYALPGLINGHAHLFGSGKPMNLSISPKLLHLIYRLAQTRFGKKILLKQMKKHAQIELMSGVTTIRSVGEFFYQDVKLRDQINNGKIVGPSLFVSGFFLSTTDGHGAPFLALESDSPWEGRKNVRKNMKHGIDWIKICVTGGVTDAKRIGEAGALQFTEEEIIAICNEAHKNHRMVAAHVESTEGMRIALRGGVDTIEHGAVMDQEIINLFKKNPKSLRGHSSLIPTFTAAFPSMFLTKAELKLSDIVIENGKLVYQEMISGFKQAVESEIEIGMGNDASMSFVTHYDIWRELDHTVRFGHVSPLTILQHATLNNAKILGIEKHYGSLEIGKRADLILLENNPLENISALRSINKVIKNGQNIQLKPIRKWSMLDTLLDQI